MTQDEIIKLAREAGFPSLTEYGYESLGRFYQNAFAAGAAHEREVCAKVCDDYADKCVEAENWENDVTQDEIIKLAREAGVVKSPFPTDYPYQFSIEELERFAELVESRKTEIAIAESYRCGYEAGAAHEREKRTQELMQLFLDPENQPTQFGTATLEYREQEVLAEREACAQFLESDLMSFASSAECAAAIRARGEK